MLKQPRLLTFCKIYAYEVYLMCLLIREYEVMDLVANWKLSQDKTKLNSHRISRLDKTNKSWTCSVSKFSVANSLDLLWVHFTPADADKTRQRVLFCLRLRCEIGITKLQYFVEHHTQSRLVAYWPTADDRSVGQMGQQISAVTGDQVNKVPTILTR